ncbi:hypothetical protein BUALT_Bualt07G0049500 [Buddleja alternifolia]|uniref:Uncharacterized protein n=1 Tax=Buddleja alternifolia TaxID=168488 RepID=A0AAV6XJ34_9LAMI|nr:hypothetical protein BUALT_Bualt07G0049500 [Buddleja alternifolia]
MKGVERELTANLVYIVNLDNLVGEIPSELTNLSALIGLNFSHNHLEGKIPAKTGDLTSLISLDLSSNNLFGTIPNSLTDSNFSSHLNLLHNNLLGQIPMGNQLQTLDNPSIYDGNHALWCPKNVTMIKHQKRQMSKIPRQQVKMTELKRYIFMEL